MAENTKIAWAHHSLNFWHGCEKVDTDCKNCYAETLSNRWGKNVWGPSATTERQRTKQPWKDILKWDIEAGKKRIRYRVFVMSMGDFFEDHPQVIQWRVEAMQILEDLKNIDILLLTKRPELIMDMVPWWEGVPWPEHIWIGTSVGTQAAAKKRIPHLLNIPARIRFLSCEPLLGEINLTGNDKHEVWPWSEACAKGEGIDWVICGGESGPKHRPMNLDWARKIRDDCIAADVPFFYKQSSGLYPGMNPELDGKTWKEFPKSLREGLG